MAQFRMAKLFDIVDPERGPVFSPEHPVLEDLDERARILEFLEDGTVIRRAPARMEDRFDPSRGKAVSITIMTDGEWIWNAGHGYYLINYGLALEPEFHEHIRSQGYRPGQPDRETQVAALEFLTAEQARSQQG